VLLKLDDVDAEYSADALEGIDDRLEAVRGRVLRQEVSDQAAGAALSAITREEDLSGLIRGNVLGVLDQRGDAARAQAAGAARETRFALTSGRLFQDEIGSDRGLA
jgi:hypothetical protein